MSIEERSQKISMSSRLTGLYFLCDFEHLYAIDTNRSGQASAILSKYQKVDNEYNVDLHKIDKTGLLTGV